MMSEADMESVMREIILHKTSHDVLARLSDACLQNQDLCLVIAEELANLAPVWPATTKRSETP